MKYVITLLLLSISLITVAQPVVYQGFEVDSAATPRGGMPFLSTFLQANLRKPVAAEAEGKGGRVILSAVIEPDGQPTDVKVMQAFRPDCGQEALRVFSRFRAWKPAYKNGKPVRQAVTIPVAFPANPPFRYENGANIAYYDAKLKVLPDSSDLAQYKQVTPLDANGLPAGDITTYERKGRVWKNVSTTPLIRKKIGDRTDEGIPIYSLGYRGAEGPYEGAVYQVGENGKLIRQTLSLDKGRSGYETVFHANGIVARKTTFGEDKNTVTVWYPNGQIESAGSMDRKNLLYGYTHDEVAAFWDSTGSQLVTNGSGAATYRQSAKSSIDSTRRTDFLERGRYVGGVKQGVWTGRYADGSYAYEEVYDNGVMKQGKSVSAGRDTIRYDRREQQPEFDGGMVKLGQFLGQNIKYPYEAQRAGIEGRVFVSFVVCTDGSLCDYEIVKSLSPDVDKEALRVVKAMSGKWTPGYRRGEAVRVKYSLPINFSLN